MLRILRCYNGVGYSDCRRVQELILDDKQVDYFIFLKCHKF